MEREVPESDDSVRPPLDMGIKGLINFVRLPLSEDLAEHEVWQEHFDVRLEWLPDNVQRICNYGFNEMLNNAIDHSAGSTVTCWATLVGELITLVVNDDGIGIF